MSFGLTHGEWEAAGGEGATEGQQVHAAHLCRLLAMEEVPTERGRSAPRRGTPGEEVQSRSCQDPAGPAGSVPRITGWGWRGDMTKVYTVTARMVWSWKRHSDGLCEP